MLTLLSRLNYLSALRDSAIVLFYIEVLGTPRAAPTASNTELENAFGPVLGSLWAVLRTCGLCGGAVLGDAVPEPSHKLHLEAVYSLRPGVCGGIWGRSKQ